MFGGWEIWVSCCRLPTPDTLSSYSSCLYSVCLPKPLRLGPFAIKLSQCLSFLGKGFMLAIVCVGEDQMIGISSRSFDKLLLCFAFSPTICVSPKHPLSIDLCKVLSWALGAAKVKAAPAAPFFFLSAAGFPGSIQGA